MSHDVSDILEVLLLAKEAGLYDPATGISSIQVVPKRKNPVAPRSRCPAPGQLAGVSGTLVTKKLCGRLWAATG